MTDRHRIAARDELPDCEARRFEVDGHPIAVVRVGDDIHAVGDTCTHQKVSLSEGELDCERLEIECWKHGSTFSLVTGEPSMLPATKPTPVYPVTVEGDDVYVEVPSR